MNERDRELLEDVLGFSERAIRLLGELSLDQFLTSEDKYYATRYCLQVIGECVKDLSAGVTRDMPTIPWSEIKAMRHRLVHGYKAISGEVVYETVRFDLRALAETVRHHLAKAENG